MITNGWEPSSNLRAREACEARGIVADMTGRAAPAVVKVHPFVSLSGSTSMLARFRNMSNRSRVEVALKEVRVEPAKHGCSLMSNPIGIQREPSTRTMYNSKEKTGSPGWAVQV